MDTKQCARCGRTKPFAEFYRSKQTRAGFSSYCKECCRLIQQHQRRPDAIAQPPRRERTTKRCPACGETKPLAEFSPKKRKTSKEGVSGYCKACNNGLRKRIYARNPDKYKIYARAYRNRTGYKAQYDSTKGRINQHNFRARSLGIPGVLSAQEWEDLKKKYDYTCLACGKREPEISLVLDHVIPVLKQGPNTIENIQPLCFSFNARKHIKTTDYRS